MFFLFGSASPSQLKNLFFFAVHKSFIKQPFPITAILRNILSVHSVWAIGLEEKQGQIHTGILYLQKGNTILPTASLQGDDDKGFYYCDCGFPPPNKATQQKLTHGFFQYVVKVRGDCYAQDGLHISHTTADVLV